MDPRDALRQFHAQTLAEPHLLRALVSHGVWRLPAGPDGEQVRPMLRQIGEERWLQVFTDAAAWAEHQRALPEAERAAAWVDTTGEWVFTTLRDELTGLEINPSLPEAVNFRQADFPVLRSWGRALAVERILSSQDATEAAARLLVDARFQIAFTMDSDGQPQLALAPDPQGRALAAVFTAPDAALTYQEAAQKALQREIRLNELEGRHLFSQLAQMPLEGIVFNCLGPVAPVAVSMQFAQAFVEA